MDHRDREHSDAKSHVSSRSGIRSKDSAVLARAREYNRIIDENRTRSKSYDSKKASSHIDCLTQNGNNYDNVNIPSIDQNSAPTAQERALTSLQQQHQSDRSVYLRESCSPSQLTSQTTQASPSYERVNHHRQFPGGSSSPANMYTIHQENVTTMDAICVSGILVGDGGGGLVPSNPRDKSNTDIEGSNLCMVPDRQSHLSTSPTAINQHASSCLSSKSSLKTPMSSQQYANSTKKNTPPTTETRNLTEYPAIVTPELLVDALSGHEDGLLAIAERLMSYYDSGYDAMGEAIIDAFADVQKLFQHVVEAAHMEGAAHEAGRREDEISRLKKIVEEKYDGNTAMILNVGGGGRDNNAYKTNSGSNLNINYIKNSCHDVVSPRGPTRHDEFIDEDVRDVVHDALRKGRALVDQDNHVECYALYEKSCHSASALLPVDSDHRGRLQLSIARAESLPPERACAILRYVMDDVLRSGLSPNSKIVMLDPSQRGDCVLARPAIKSRLDDFSVSDESNHGRPSSSPRIIMDGGMGSNGVGVGHTTGTAESIAPSTDAFVMGRGAVLQSAEEALASLVEEMKEVLGAPIYNYTPLQDVAGRFWKALAEAQRNVSRNEERLEQKLGTLKAEFLLAREEWEEKSNALVEEKKHYKKKLESLKEKRCMESARVSISQVASYYNVEDDGHFDFEGIGESSRSSQMRGNSVASFGSLAHHAKNIVGTFSCTGTDHSVSNKEIKQRHRGGGENRGRTSFRERDISPPSVASSSLSQSKASSRKTSQSSNSYYNPRAISGRNRRND